MRTNAPTCTQPERAEGEQAQRVAGKVEPVAYRRLGQDGAEEQRCGRHRAGEQHAGAVRGPQVTLCDERTHDGLASGWVAAWPGSALSRIVVVP